MKNNGTAMGLLTVVTLLAGCTVALADIPFYATRIAARNFNTCLVKADGTAWACGRNNFGQIGNGTNGNICARPVQVSGLAGVTNVAAGKEHTVAMKSDSTVWAWGKNNYGQVGDGTNINRLTPVQVAGGLTGVVAVAAGTSHTVALKNNETVWAWGYNYYGQLGDGTNIDRRTPVQVAEITGVVAIAAGDCHTVALKTNGTVWAWGFNFYGQLGDGTNINRWTPVQVAELTGVVAIATGEGHAIAVKGDGSVWAWGYNYYGQLGDGTNVTSLTPVQVMMADGTALTGVVAVAAGARYTVALKTNGTVWAWGDNSAGQIGDGTSGTNRLAPVQVEGLTGVVAIAAGGSHTVAMKGDGTVWVWGANSYGQLGDGTQVMRVTPVQMRVPYSIPGGFVPVASNSVAICGNDRTTKMALPYTDIDSRPFQMAVTVDAGPSHGSLSIGYGPSVYYTPTMGYVGQDSFTWRITDDTTNTSAQATCTLTVGSTPPGGTNRIVLIVNPNVYTALSNEVARLMNDLMWAGKDVVIQVNAYGANDVALYNYLKDQYTNNHLEGAILIGTQPEATTAAVNSSLTADWASDHSYCNMLEYVRPVNDGLAHIWVTRLRASEGVPYAPADLEVGLLRRAFDANHYYRTGKLRYPHRAFWGLAGNWPYVSLYYAYPETSQRLDGYYATWPQVTYCEAVPALMAGCNFDNQNSHGNESIGGGIYSSDAYYGIFQANIFQGSSCGGDTITNPFHTQLFTKHGGLVFSGMLNTTDFIVGREPLANHDKQDRLLRGASLGSEILAAGRIDALHNNGDLSVQVMQGPPNAMPTVTSFTASKTTVCVGEPVTFTVAVSDSDTTACTSPYVNFKHRVEWYMDGWNYGINNPTYTTDDTVNSNSKQFQYTNIFVTVGTRAVRALVMDEWRAVAWQEITVSVLPPVVTCAVTVPTNGAVVIEGTNLTITAEATVTYGSVSNVEFTLDGLKIATALNSPYSFVWTNAVKGAHVLTAKATDGVGYVTNSTAVSLSVLPIATCTITAPANGSALKAGTDLTITATAAVLTGTISKVEFFHDGLPISEVTSAPYACVWSNVPIGFYALTARATQSDGRTGDSAAVLGLATASGSWEGVYASGGTVTNYTQDGTNWTAHIFTNTSGETFTPLKGSLNVEYMVVAGGGSGGRVNNSGNHAGGGGAGGLLANSPSSLLTISSAQTITVGAGGAGRTTDGETGAKGGSSSIGTLVVATGGGGGTSYGGTTTDKNGGSGGGASAWGGAGTGIAGPPRQGYNGGADDGASPNGAGGGGAGGIGGNSTAGVGGDGGPGVTNSITGTATVYAGGGGGPGTTTQGAGGSGIGGNGMQTGSGTTINGRDGTGSGGGGVGNGTSGKGGDGIVIVRYVFGTGSTILAAPTGLTATASATNRIELAWSDNATNETGYVVNRSLDSTNWTFVTLTAVNATNVSDTGLATNTLYYYSVAATNADGLSAYCFASARTWSVYEAWLRSRFDGTSLTNSAISGATADPDHDGLNNEQEYRAGTDPNSASSCLVLYALTNNPALPGEFVVRWQSVTGKTYSVLAATNLLTGFSSLTNGLPATPTVNVYTDKVNGAGQKFYRVGVE
jgi:alpha-tubulin suppressor-like RCC1 family protein